MKIAILSSSRSDYGIYRPLLQKLNCDKRFEITIIAFGMHLIERFGNTIQEIYKDAFGKIVIVEGMSNKDSKSEIVKGYGKLIMNFGKLWDKFNYDFVFALGDRWEMSAAVQSTIPFEIKIIHFHGGETTLGAIDNVYRHQISIASKIHFTAADLFSTRVKELVQDSENIHTVGSISLENMHEVKLPTWETVKVQFQIPFDKFILVTVHPESVNANDNSIKANVICEALEQISQNFSLIITKPNADVMGSLFNKKYIELQKKYPEKIKLISSFGKLNYFVAMRKSMFLLGNSSIGIIEAASYNKWVVNVGNRQKGRLQSGNIINVPFIVNKILQAVRIISKRKIFRGNNLYEGNRTTDRIINEILDFD